MFIYIFFLLLINLKCFIDVWVLSFKMKMVTQILLDVTKIILCLFGAISVFFTIIDLTYFLSVPNHTKVTTSNKGKN